MTATPLLAVRGMQAAPAPFRACATEPGGSNNGRLLDDAYCAVAEALLLTALSLSTPASKMPLPLQSVHAVTT